MSIIRPTLPPALRESDDIGLLFDSEDSISGYLISDGLPMNIDHKRVSISDSRIVKTDLSQVTLSRFDVLNTEFIGCSFTASKFPHSSWHTTLIEGARCSGMQVTESVLKNITYRNCKLELANFRFTRLENIIFEDCVLDDVDFYSAQLKNVEFIRCTLNKVTFANARMLKVDISQSTIDGVNGISSLRGVTASYDQIMQLTPMFAAEAGIKIK